ncbi:hypothetical protein HPB52_009485 [Rhipicephalus sanguineus]|uniref:Protein nlrc3 n=1 Tax=Rhipicephalus sanguineus TaxID=34632 RepID=A0A9D4QD25_RHISA|nr:hypothetical protein HPB52_009485 [Rhipicephalus sanguineus]
MEPPSTRVPGMESAIHTLDSARLLLVVERLRDQLKSGGVDLQEPCSDVPGKTKCWLRLHLPVLNEVLWKVSMQVVEHAPGALTLSHVERTDIYTERTGTSFMNGAILLCSLVERHMCIKRLLLNAMAFPLWYFPSMLGSALRANRSILEVEEDPVDMVRSGHEMRQCRALSCALGNLASRLKYLSITSLKLDRISAEDIAIGITKSKLRRLHLCNEMSASMTRKLLSAVSSCQSLTSLEFAGFRQFSRSSAIALASALKLNKTLRKLRVRYLADDVPGIILASLKSNEVLEELSLDYSVDHSRSTLWDGLQALRENRVLKRLEITYAYFTSSCAIVLAEVLRQNNVIEEISLSTNFIRDVGARALAQTLQESSSLKHLDVSKCRLTCNVVSKFVEAVSRNSAIECVRLGHVDIPEDWAPTLPVTEDVSSRLQVSWNTRALEQWAACGAFRFPRACLRWSKDANCCGIVQWLAAARVNSALLVELVIECPFRVDAESTDAVVSFIKTTPSLKKLIMRPSKDNYIFSTAILNSLARNKSVCEAEFHQTLRAHLDVKALEALLLANRTLHRLKFRYDSLPSKAPAMLARALGDNFVFLTLEFEDQNAQNDMYGVVSALNRNRSLLNRAVECVLDAARDEHSTRALRLLSTTDSLLDAVSMASGKVRDECRCLVLEAVRSLECQHSEDVVVWGT